MHHDLHSLMDKYKEMLKKIGTSSSINQLLTSTNLSHSAEIKVVPLPPKLNILAINIYKWSKDPVEHLETFKAHMTLHGFFEKIACKTFPLTLKGMAQGWVGAL